MSEPILFLLGRIDHIDFITICGLRCTRLKSKVKSVQQGSKEIVEGVHLQKGHASNSATMSTCSGSVCLSLDAEPAVVPNGSRDTDARPLVATSRPRLRGAAASPPESSMRSLDWCTR